MRSSPLLLIGIVLLSSCAAGGGGRETSLTHDAAPESLTALIALRVLEQRGGMRKVGIVILQSGFVLSKTMLLFSVMV